jgi:glycosyltransferase involved in cell wall biosynthesis
VDPGNPEALAEAMIQALTNAELRQEMIAAARDRVIRNFNNRNLIGDLAGLHIRALRENSAKPV